MTFSVNFQTRDFATPITLGQKVTPLKMSWSVYGGPDAASLRLDGPALGLEELTKLLRSPVTLTDPTGQPTWWGLVSQVTIYLENTQIRVSLDTLFNSVKVSYSFVSPDNRLGDHQFTTPAADLASQQDYGTKEKVLHQFQIDDDFAAGLQQTFLAQHAWPRSLLSQRLRAGAAYALINCEGWFKTLAWQNFQNHHGFYANYGPSPGAHVFGYTNIRLPAQRITPGINCQLKYLYFQIRKQASPTSNLIARCYSESGGVPNTILGTSSSVSGAAQSATSYQWVKFTFPSPISLTAGVSYWFTVSSTTTNTTNYYLIRTDENAGYFQDNHYARYYNGSAWVLIPNITQPATPPHLIFRAVTLQDTADQLQTAINAADQFLPRVKIPQTGVLTSPYRYDQINCLGEIKRLMDLGTSNHRRILATVSHQRHLEFYEQPDPDLPTCYMNQNSRFQTFQGALLKPHQPPVGQFVRFSGSNRITMPFDKARVPTCFIEGAEYNPATGRVRVKTV